MIKENIAHKVKQYLFNQRDSSLSMSTLRQPTVQDSTYFAQCAQMMESTVPENDRVRLGNPVLHKDATGLAKYTL